MMYEKLRKIIPAIFTHISFPQKLFISFIIGILLLLVISFFSSYYVNKLVSSAKWVEHTVVVLKEAEHTLSLTNEIISGGRGYVITGNPEYLESFMISKDSINNYLSKLKQLTKDNPSQQIRIDSLISLVSRRIDLSLQIIHLRNEKGFNAASELVATLQGKTLTDKIRILITKIQDEEERLLIERRRENEKSSEHFYIVFYTLLSSIVVLLVVVFFTVRHNLSARLKAEVNLQKSIREITDYKYALDESSIVAITDQKGIIRHANENFSKISGFSREELVGRDHGIVNSGYHSKEFMRDLWVTIGRGGVWRGELKNKTKQGAVYWVDTTIVPFLDDKGKIYQYVAVKNDITRRKHAEEESVKSENRFRGTLDKMLEGVEIIGFDWRYIYVNEAYTRQVNYSKEALLGFTVMEKFPGIEQTEIFKTIQRCFKERVSIHFEDEFTFPDNTKKWFEMSFQPVPEGVFILLIDITERINFQQQQALFASIVNSSEDAIISKNLDGIITSWNHGAEISFGYAPDKIIGKHISILIPPGPLNEEAEIIEKIKKGQSIDHYETQRIREDGSMIDVSITLSPIRDSSGNVIGASKISRDITERLQSERALLRSESKFRRIFDSKMVGIIFWDEKGEIIEANDRFLEIVGYSRTDFENGILHWNKMTPPEYAELDERGSKQIKLTGVCLAFEKEYFRKDGSRVPILIGAAYLNDSMPVKGVAYVTDITEQKKAEQQILNLNEELTRSEKKFRELIENSYDIVAINDENLKILYRSPAAMKITGWTNEDFAEKNSLDRTHPDDLPIVTEVIKKVLATPGTPFPVSYRTKHKDGHYVFLEGLITNMIGNEAIRGIVSNLRDVTGTRIAEEKIRQSERIYKTIASSILGSIICIFDRDYRYTFIEGDLLEKFGYSKEMLLGNKVQDVLPAERYTSLVADFAQVFKGETFSRQDKRGEYYTTTRFVPLKDEHNEVQAAMVVVIDVTELKKAEQYILELNAGLEQKVAQRTAQLEEVNKDLQTNLLLLKESEEKFSKIFETSPVGISIAALQTGVIVDVNKSFLQLSGFKYEEVINHTLADLKIVEIAEWEKIKQERIEKGMVRDREVYVSNKAGDRFPVLASLDQFSIENAKYGITIVYDISERKRAEDQLMAANKELESFSYSVSHDLRAPLRAVNGFASMLEEDYSHLLDEEGKRLLDVIKKNATKMGFLIDDLLEFSRLGKKEIRKSYIDMNALVKNTISEINESTKHHADIVVQELSPVMGDFALMSHVMSNLILNAIKYSSKKEKPQVYIGCKKENGEIIFYVSDNGVGFDMKYVHKLFGVFQRLHSAEDFQGTGVGLAIVERIILKHGGKVWAQGVLDEGSAFYFSIPESN